MANENIIRILVPIAILFIMGVYLLKQKDNAFSKAFSRDKYDHKKVSTLLGLACFGIAISCIPSLLSVIFQKKWLNVFSVVDVFTFTKYKPLLRLELLIFNEPCFPDLEILLL